MDNRADIFADEIGFGNYRPGRNMPAYPYIYHSSFIIYGKRQAIKGDPFTEIFDLPSYVAIGISFVLLSVVIWMAMLMEGSDVSAAKVVVAGFGNIFGQERKINFLKEGTSVSSLFFLDRATESPPGGPLPTLSCFFTLAPSPSSA